MSSASVSDSTSRAIAPDFEELYRTYSPMVYRTAKGVLGNAEDAEDVLQNVFLRLLRRELTPDITRNLKAYLYRAAVNRSLDLIEYRRRRALADDLRARAVNPAHGHEPGRRTSSTAVRSYRSTRSR